MMHNNMTPNTGEDDMYWALILRGIGLGLLFVPITTLSTLSGKNIEGAAFTGMMRQLGAHLVLQSSLLLSRASVRASCKLVAHLDGTKFEVQQRLQLLQKDLCQRIYCK
jgi:DHA2 family multidrug resistance protein